MGRLKENIIGIFFLQINSSLPNKMPTNSVMTKCGPVRGLTSIDVSILVVFYYLCIRPDKKGGLLGGSSLIRRMVFWQEGPNKRDGLLAGGAL